MRIEVIYKDGGSYRSYRNDSSARKYQTSISKDSSSVRIQFKFGSLSRGVAETSGYSSKRASVTGGSLSLAPREAAAIAREILWFCEHEEIRHPPLQMEMNLNESANEGCDDGTCRIFYLASSLKVDKFRIFEEANRIGNRIDEDSDSIPWDLAKKIYLRIRGE